MKMEEKNPQTAKVQVQKKKLEGTLQTKRRSPVQIPVEATVGKTPMAQRPRPSPGAAVTAESVATRRKNTGVAAKALRKGEAEMKEETEAAARAETGSGRGGISAEVGATAEQEIETGGEEVEAEVGRGTEKGAVTVETDTAGGEDVAGVRAGTDPESSSSTEMAAEAEKTLLEDGGGAEAEAATGRPRGRKGGAEVKAGTGNEADRKPAVRKLLKQKRPEQRLTDLKAWMLKPSKTAGERLINEKIEVEVGVQKQQSFP